MELTISAAQQQTMSSREIAELTGKEHANVMRDIRNTLEALGKDALSFEGIYLDTYGREKPCFYLPQDLTLTLVSGYDIPLRHRVVTRLKELEDTKQAPAMPALPQTFQEALRALADETDKRVQLEADNKALAIGYAHARNQVEDAAPKVAAFNALCISDGAVCLTDAAKIIGVQRKTFLATLHAYRWIYRRPGCSTWIGYQGKEKSLSLCHKFFEVEQSDGSKRQHSQVLVTPKGVAELHVLFNQPKPNEIAIAA